MCYAMLRYRSFKEFYCDSCMSVPGFEDAKENATLVAIYRSPGSANWVYLTKGNRIADVYVYYTDEFFACFGKVPCAGKLELRSNQHLTGYQDGETSGFRGTIEIPEVIHCLDSSGQILESYHLTEEFLENIEASNGRYFLKGWERVLFPDY